jgi:hypothetical protein
MNEQPATIKAGCFLMEGRKMNNDEPLLPLDERFRNAEQFAFHFEEEKPQQPPTPHAQVCIGNCKICQYCDGD